MATLTTYGGEPIPAECCVEIGCDANSSTWNIATETPIAFVYDRRNYAVMLGSPSDLEDFAIGFSLSERVVDSSSEIHSLDVLRSERGVELRIRISDHCVQRLDIRQTRRNLVGPTGCGLCGLDNADVLFERLPSVSPEPVTIPDQALQRAARLLRDVQPLNRSTHSVHAAAWVGFDGDIVLAREDVGRHNALDKLVGAFARSSLDPASGFVLMSSRCSYEIIEKAARMGAPAVASLSAPTSFAIRKATEAKMALYCRSGETFVRIA